MSRHLRPLLLLLLALAPLLVAAATRAGEDGLPEAKRALEGAIAEKDAGRARDALKALAGAAGEKAVKVVAAATAAVGDLDVYADLVQAATAMANASEPALKEVVRTASKDGNWTVRFLFVEALAGVDKPEAHRALFEAYEDKHETVAAQAMRVSAARKLKACVGPLIDACERYGKKEKDGKLATEARLALGAITGESFTTAGDWRRWWEVNEAGFDPAKVAEKKAAGEAEGGTVMRRVADRGEYDFIEKLDKGDILVVKGQMDTTETVLGVLKLPHTLFSREEAVKKLATLDPKAVLVYNCDSIPKGKLGEKEGAALARFVEAGGYLFTTDWCLTEALVPAFKDALLPGATTAEAFEAKIAPSRAAATHPYMRDVFPSNPFERAKMKWRFDNSCCTIKLSARAIGLAECEDLGKKAGAPCVATTFRHGKGAVLHMIGHFREQKDGAGDGFAMQQMLVNFIVEKQKFRKKAKDK